ncbi:MAG: MFS transporter [Candidatus Magasanikbacteria bacterium]|nr:MFS transporter [Candidatus Magasanikbacteria bacterium]
MNRPALLKKNFSKIFWITALVNVKVVNVVMSLFYVHRGITLSQIFTLAILWSVVNMIFEVPSSYLADRWGRKKTIIVGILGSMMYWSIFLFAHSFVMFAIGVACYAFSIAMLSGTQEALLYDTGKELDKEKDNIKELGKFHSSLSLFKIITPIIAVLIAKDMSEIQFMILILIDVIATSIALFISSTLIEARHVMDVEKIERGVLLDAWKLIRTNRYLLSGIISKIGIFIAFLVTWQYYHTFFTNMGVSIIILGFGWGLNHLVIFLVQRNIGKYISHMRIPLALDILNTIFTATIILFVCLLLLVPQHPYLLYACFLASVSFEAWRNPLYSQFFNGQSHSYNRATTLSLSNFLKSVLDIPVLLLAAILIEKDVRLPYVLACVISLIIITFFRLSSKKQPLHI